MSSKTPPGTPPPEKKAAMTPEEMERRVQEQIQRRVKEEMARRAAALAAKPKAEGGAKTPVASGTPAKSPAASPVVKSPTVPSAPKVPAKEEQVDKPVAVAKPKEEEAKPPSKEVDVAPPAVKPEVPAEAAKPAAESVDGNSSETPRTQTPTYSEPETSENPTPQEESPVATPTKAEPPAAVHVDPAKSVSPPAPIPEFSGSIPNDNGIFNFSEARSTVDANIYDLGDLESVLEERKVKDVHRVVVNEFETPRESGRCLKPSKNEGDVAPPSSHIELQMGFFAAKQRIIDTSKPAGFSPKQEVCDRIAEDGSGRTSWYEAKHVVEADVVSEASNEGPLGIAANKRLFSATELNKMSAEDGLNAITKNFAFADPIQAWEKARGRVFNPPAENAKGNPGFETSTQGATVDRLWASEYDSRAPVPSKNMFTGGVLYRIEVADFNAGLHTTHDKNADPLFVSLALYSIQGNTPTKVSENFSLHFGTEAFFPYKTPFETQDFKSAVTFIPQEFRTGSLYLVCRVSRLSTETFDSIVDKYVRPTSYKERDIVALREEMQQTAMYSDATEELGWYAISVTERGRLLQGEGVIDKLLRSETLSDAEMAEMITNEKKRMALKCIPFRIVVKLKDVSGSLVSFPQHMPEPTSIETEAVISIKERDGAPKTHRYVSCAVPILNCGFFNSYVNVMYVRLKKVKLGAVLSKLPAKQRNLLIQVCVKESDSNLSPEGLPAIYGKSMSAAIVESSAWTEVRRGRTDFDLHEEIKIQLPLLLTEKHHLFFTFYGVSLQKGTFDERFKCLGVAAAPIFTNGELRVAENLELSILSADGAKGVQNGYLTKMGQTPQTSYIGNGSPLFTLSTAARSSVYVSNPTAAALFRSMPNSIKEITRDGGIFETSGIFMEACEAGKSGDSIHLEVLTKVSALPLPELIAFFPILTSYLIAVISSQSGSVGVNPRRTAFKCLVDSLQKVHQYETSKQRGAKGPISTALTTYLYHYFSNEVLFGCDASFPVAQAIAEVWLVEIQELSLVGSSGSPQKKPAGYAYLHRMGELSWFLFDLIARSTHLQSLERKHLPRTRRFDISFYAILRQLVASVDEKMVSASGLPQIIRVSAFLRSLLLSADRGEVLRLVKHFIVQVASRSPSNACSAIRIFLDYDDAVQTCVVTCGSYVPQFLLRICVDVLKPMIVGGSREQRVNAVQLMYTFAVRVANAPRIDAAVVCGVANAMFDFVEYAAQRWNQCKQIAERDGNLGVFDKRQLHALTQWCLFYMSREKLSQWVQQSETSAVVGFLQMLMDAQATFRFQNGQNKCEVKARPDIAELLSLWDSRYAALVNFIGCQVTVVVMRTLLLDLRSVKEERPHAVVFPFFTLVEQLVSLHNSTDALQCGALVIHNVTRALFPEVISRKARMCSGIVLLTLRLLTSSSAPVREMAAETYRYLASHFFHLQGSLSKLKHLTATATVLVAESHGRDMKAARGLVADAFAGLATKRPLPKDHDFRTRYVEDISAATSAAEKISIDDSVLTTERIPTRLPSAEEQKIEYATEFEIVRDSATALFSSVLQLHEQDDGTSSVSIEMSHLHIIRALLQQCTLREAMKWLVRLQEYHAKEGNHAEAASTAVFNAALSFRVTEMLLDVKPKAVTGMPRQILTHVFFHDYIRVLPELKEALSDAALRELVLDLNATPDDKLFTVDGQIFALKAAAEMFGKGSYYELAVLTIKVVDAFVMAKSDFKSSAVVHGAIQQWCSAIATNSANRVGFNYYLVRATSLSRDGDVVITKRVFKSALSLKAFREHALRYHRSEEPDAEVVAKDDDSAPSDANEIFVSVIATNPVVNGVQLDFADVLDRKLQFDTVHYSEIVSYSGAGPDASPLERLRVSIATLFLERQFPSSTTCILVKDTAVKVLSVEDSIVYRLEGLKRELADTPQNAPDLVQRLGKIFSPYGFSELGSYFLAIVQAKQPAKVLDELSQFVAAARKKIDGCTMRQEQSSPEIFAKLIQTAINVECVLEAKMSSGDSLR